jgi:hypothetical protein
MVVFTYHLSYKESINKKVEVQISLGKKQDLISEITTGKKGWQHG